MFRLLRADAPRKQELEGLPDVGTAQAVVGVQPTEERISSSAGGARDSL